MTIQMLHNLLRRGLWVKLKISKAQCVFVETLSNRTTMITFYSFTEVS